MRPLDVDYLPKSQAWAKWSYALSAVLLSIAAQQAWLSFQTYKKLKVLEAEVAQRTAERVAAAAADRIRSQTPVAEPPYAKDAAAIARIASFDTAGIFAAIESTQVQGIRVTQLEISPADSMARIELEILEPKALMEYIQVINTGLDTGPRWQLVRTRAGLGAGPGSAELVYRK